MNIRLQRILAAGLALLTVAGSMAGLTACRGNATTSETEAATSATTQSSYGTLAPDFVKDPLTHLIFGSRSYMQGDVMVGEITVEALPQQFVSPMAMTLDSLDDWSKFYGGLPRRGLINDDFADALNGIDEAFFKTQCLIAVILYEKSPEYTHEVTEVAPHEGKLRVSITTHVTENAVQESAFRCILIPVTKDYAPLSVKVSMTKEIN